MPTIGLLLGSARTNGNAAGLIAWITSHFHERFPDPTYKLVVVDPHSTLYPSGPVTDAVMPALIRDPSQYADTDDREWSTFVSSCAGFIILTPQFNRGYPGGLKNAPDHLYWEWKGKPALIVAYGGHGGGRCAVQLQQVLEEGLKMKVVAESVCVTLPEDYIRGAVRVDVKYFENAAMVDVPSPVKGAEFLLEYSEVLKEGLDKLVQSFAQ